jgi:hypothetical protein
MRRPRIRTGHWPSPRALYGVPLFVRGSMDPSAWRLLDTDGRVIKEGTL